MTPDEVTVTVVQRIVDMPANPRLTFTASSEAEARRTCANHGYSTLMIYQHKSSASAYTCMVPREDEAK